MKNTKHWDKETKSVKNNKKKLKNQSDFVLLQHQTVKRK